MYRLKKFKNGTLWKKEQTRKTEQMEKWVKEWEAAGFDVEVEQVAESPATGPHPTAMYTGDPGARSSIQAEARWGEDNELDEMFWNDDEEMY